MKVKKHTGLGVAMLSILVLLCTASTTNAKVPIPLQSLQLNQPFTIIYNVAGQFYDQGAMIHRNMRVTLSYDGEHLLYRNEDTATHAIHTVLYDGHETYIMDSNSLIAEIDPGFDFARMIFCPLPGIGIPHVPFFVQGFPSASLPEYRKEVAPDQSSEVKYIDNALFRTPNQVRDYGAFWYSDREAHAKFPRAGTASVMSVPTSIGPKVLWYDTFDNIGPNVGTLWEFYDHKNFQGRWLATKIRMRWFATLAGSHRNVLFQSASFNLESATNGPLEPSAYDPTKYLPDHANIGDMTGRTTKSFVYKAGKVPLQTQRQSGLEVSEALAISAKSRTNSGLIGLVSVTAITAFWFIWRLKGAKR